VATATHRVTAATVYTGGRLHAARPAGASAVVVLDGRVGFVGGDEAARRFASGAPTVDLGGRLVTPAFVDAHLHTIQTGQRLTGVDLTGAACAEDLLELLSRYVRERPRRGVVVGYGWDDSGWQDSRLPLPADLDRACDGAAVYLARVDVHSALVSTALLDKVPGIASTVGFATDGPVTRDAHHRCRAAANALLTDTDRRGAARSALRRAAALGVAVIHEMAGPHLGPVQDLVRVQEVAAEVGVDVVCYWGQLAAEADIADLRMLGVRGLAGDLCVDGSIGSRTAALAEPYADHPGTGVRYLDPEQIAGHVIACTRAGLQAGFHCIGDAAVADTVTGLTRAAAVVGTEAVRRARHRLEHVEMAADADIATLARLGISASMQPAFDAAWGGPGQLYERRLGTRARRMNRLASMRSAGVPLALGSDSPVTPLGGWDAVRAATSHWNPAERLPLADAFRAATAGGGRAGGDADLGRIEAGARASIAVWQQLEPVNGQPGRVLDRAEQGPVPRCAATLARGRVIFSDGTIAGLGAGPDS
jgi:predicted amidohydrolase YtcJ